MKTVYQTEIYNATKGFFYFILVFALSVFVLTYIGKLLNASSLYAVVAFACLCILPFVFEKKIKGFFTKRILIEFDDLSFSITQYNSGEGKVSKRLNINWSDIVSYKFYFSPAKNTILTLHLRDGSRQQWGFKDNKTSKEAIGGESLFTIFHTYIKQYNMDRSDNDRIVLNIGFFNSKAGTVLLYSEMAIIISGFIFHLFMHPQSSFLTLLMGFSIAIQQFSKRKQEKELFDRISML